MTVRKLLIREENGLETRVEYDGMAAALKGAVNGVAELDSGGRVPSEQLPSYVDDVIEVADFASLPTTGESGKIYVTLYDRLTWRWSGSGYVEISASLALGETSSTAYRGDRGKTAYDHSQISSGNPHNSTPADLGALTAHNPTFTGTLSGPRALLSEVGLFKEDAGDATRGSWYGVGVTPGTNNFAFRAADDGSVAEMNGSSNIGLAIGGTNKIVIGSTAVVLQSGVGLIIADETAISDQREAALRSAQVDALAGAGSGLVLCDADGDLYRGALGPATIGASPALSVSEKSGNWSLDTSTTRAIRQTASGMLTLPAASSSYLGGWVITATSTVTLTISGTFCYLDSPASASYWYDTTSSTKAFVMNGTHGSGERKRIELWCDGVEWLVKC